MALTVSVDDIVRGSRNPALGVRPHWQRIRLREIASVLNGFAFKSAQFTSGDGIPLIRIRDVGNNSTDTNYVGEFDERYIVKPGDLLVGMDGDFNCARWRGPLGLLNQRVCKITLKSEQYLSRFLDYALPGYLKAINNATSSVTVKHLSSRTIEDIPLPLPPPHEQEEIVAELERQFSRLDEAVANLKRARINLKRCKTAILQAAIEGRLVPNETELERSEGRDFESGSDLRTRIRKSSVSKTAVVTGPKVPLDFVGTVHPPLPEGWGWATCDQLLEDIEAGASFKCVERPPLPGETGVLKVSAVTWGEFDEEESKTCVDLGRLRDEFLVKPGDFLFSRANTIDLVGACVIVRSITKPLMLSDKTLRFRLRPIVLDEWLLACLRSKHGRAEITRLATGNQDSMRNIGQDRIRRIRIPMPPLKEQRRILTELNRRCSTIDSVARMINESLIRAQRLGQAALAEQFGAGRERAA